MSDKARAMIDELVSAAVAFGRGQLPDWQTRIEVARVALREYIEGLEPRWIPVSERLPEGEKVLVLWKDGTIHLDWTFIDGGSYYWWNSGQAVVTHWTPLPTPPEVEE